MYPKVSQRHLLRAAGHLVTAEVLRRGGIAALDVAGKQVRVAATNAQETRRITLRVKYRTSGDWQTSTSEGAPRTEPAVVDEYWVLVDFSDDQPTYYVLPAWWIANDIHVRHQKYLDDHGGHRRDNDDSTHHRIETHRVIRWEQAWDQLGIFPAAK